MHLYLKKDLLDKRPAKNILSDSAILVELGKLIQTIRIKNGLKHSQIGDWLGIDAEAVERVELGVESLSATEWFEFCARTGTPADEILNIGTRSSSPPQEVWFVSDNIIDNILSY